MALLALGATELEEKEFLDAREHLRAAAKRLPKLADYTSYLSAAAAFELKQFETIEEELKPVWGRRPASPLIGKAFVLTANTLIQRNKTRQAVAYVQEHRADLSEPQGELLLAHALESAGDPQQAITHYHKVVFDYPASKEAPEADAVLLRLRAELGNAYVPGTPEMAYSRALKLIDAKEFQKARTELQAITGQLRGEENDIARVRIGVTYYLERENDSALNYLRSLRVPAPEADAERLFYLLQSARRLDRVDEMRSALEELARLHPHSKWRREALTAAANYYTLDNQIETYEPLFRACYETFAADPLSAYCHWRAAWGEYLKGRPEAEEILREHLRRYPDSDKATSALYFLGRLSERRGDWSGAKAYYVEIASNYPNYFYAVLARARLRDSRIAPAPVDDSAAAFLTSIQWPKRRRIESFEPSPETRQRIERARLLASAGLDDLAESELRFGAKHDGQPQIDAMEAAELANQRDEPDRGIRLIKSLAPGYIFYPLDSTPERFWRLAFPFPYRHALEQYSREHDLDPFLVAALIRQESEFNRHALSHANAHGLTQVMPATGRQISRKFGVRRFSAETLFEPGTNLRIGTYYLKALLDSLNGKWEATLASYNAGKTRVVNWLSWADYREPAEFIESIPFTETRNYVQSVLRNADMYRKLYASRPVAAASGAETGSGR